MDKNTFHFDLIDRYTPKTVIKKFMEQIEEVTRGYVIGNIEEYHGNVSSYTKNHIPGVEFEALQMDTKKVTVDIQKDLGEQDTEDHKYEVFLTVKGLEHYKYRMMFVRYGTVSYPATIVMNKELAKEYSGTWNDTFSLASMKELEDMMNLVLNSNRMVSLIQNLINESLRQELEEKDSYANA